MSDMGIHILWMQVERNTYFANWSSSSGHIVWTNIFWGICKGCYQLFTKKKNHPPLHLLILILFFWTSNTPWEKMMDQCWSCGKHGHCILPLASITVPIKTAASRNQWGPARKRMLHEPCSLVFAFHLVTRGRGCGKKIRAGEKLFY